MHEYNDEYNGFRLQLILSERNSFIFAHVNITKDVTNLDISMNFVNRSPIVAK